MGRRPRRAARGPDSRLSSRAQGHARLHVDLALQREVGDRRLGLGHPARDRLLRARELHRRSSRPSRSRAARAARVGALGRDPGGAATVGAWPRLLGRLRSRREHVRPHDPPARAAARQRVQIHLAARAPSAWPAARPYRALGRGAPLRVGSPPPTALRAAHRRGVPPVAPLGRAPPSRRPRGRPAPRRRPLRAAPSGRRRRARSARRPRACRPRRPASAGSAWSDS